MESSKENEIARQQVPVAASELNNLLQVIAGTSEVIENIWDGSPGSEKYFAMLRASVERAAEVTSELVRQVGGCEKKVLLHPDLGALLQRQEAERARQPRGTILVVDDEPMTRELTARVLDGAGFAVREAANGFECLDLLVQQPGQYDAVLLDLTMPFLDGEETFDRIRTLAPALPVILTTGFIDEIRLQGMFARGLSAFLRKPLPPDELVSQLTSLLEIAGAGPKKAADGIMTASQGA